MFQHPGLRALGFHNSHLDLADVTTRFTLLCAPKDLHDQTRDDTLI